MTICIGGPPASGKTALGRSLAPALSAALLDLDVVTAPLTELVCRLIGAQDLSEPTVAELTRTPRYDTLFDIADDIGQTGLSTVLVAPFTAERQADRWAEISTRFLDHSTPTLIWLSLPPIELARRLARRAAPRDSVKLRDPAAYIAGLDLDSPTAPHLSLDATASTHDLLRQTLDHVAPET